MSKLENKKEIERKTIGWTIIKSKIKNQTKKKNTKERNFINDTKKTQLAIIKSKTKNQTIGDKKVWKK